VSIADDDLIQVRIVYRRDQSDEGERWLTETVTRLGGRLGSGGMMSLPMQRNAVFSDRGRADALVRELEATDGWWGYVIGDL